MRACGIGHCRVRRGRYHGMWWREMPDGDQVQEFAAALRLDIGGRALREQRALRRDGDPNAASLREFEGIRIDACDWPLVVMEMPEGSVSDDAVHQALADLERLMVQTPAGTRFFSGHGPLADDAIRPLELQRRYASANGPDGPQNSLSGRVSVPSRSLPRPCFRAITTPPCPGAGAPKAPRA